jgi:hypothetical protein
VDMNFLSSMGGWVLGYGMVEESTCRREGITRRLYVPWTVGQ